MTHDDVSVFFENSESNEEMEIATQPIRPKSLPQAKHIRPFEFTFEPDQEHSEEEKEIGGICRLKMKIKSRIHELNKVIKREQLVAHA